MKLTFLGANHEVTGSCTLLEAAGQRYLIDCGMEQGKDVYENQPIPVAPGEIDGVLATHAHIDHTGLLPLLVRNGFRGRIYATRPTAELCSIMLRDSAHIQEFEAEWKNRKGQRSGAEPVEPMYTIQDAEAAIALLRGYDYNKEIELAPGIVIRFVDVGHLLGSSSIEIWVTENGATTKLVFSGDIGNHDQPIIKDPTYLKDADYVFMESTYGDRSHGPRPDYVAELAKILQRTFDRGGNVVIPSFAVGRTQELLYFIREIKEKNLVTGHGCFPVYIDSPLAIEATRIFKDTDSSCFDEETNALLAKGIDPIQFPGLKVSVTSDESRAINTDPVPKVIISASGMCEAGRIRHHLKHNLWRKECTVLFVGYQAVNTLGRSLLEGADNVKLFGESIEVQAEICQLTGLSGHADREGLLKWVNSFEPKPKRVFIIHGEDEVENIFAQTLTEQGFNACAPYNGEQWAIGAEGAVCLKEGTDSSCFDEETNALLAKGIDPIQFPGLKVSVTSDESRAINTDPVPKVIISASGMCEAGRIRHHLKHNLWRKECTVLFVGYQAVNTLGRSLLEGADNVKLFGESIEVQAEICQLTGLSGHADREGLLKWVNSFEPKPKRVFIIHGEDEVENIFAQTLTEQGFNACAPYNGEQWAIGAEGAVCLKEGTRIRIEHHVSEGAARAATVFQRLLNAGKRLLRVIEHNEDGANKDLAKFADQINALCDKWDR